MENDSEVTKQVRKSKLTTYITLAVLNFLAFPSAFILVFLLNAALVDEMAWAGFVLFFPSLILIPITGAILLATVIADIVFVVHLMKRKGKSQNRF